MIGGRFHWQGRLTGPLIGPTFAGHVKGTEARYGALYWDELEGELTYSPEELHLARWRARRGRSSAELELSLALDDWSFSPDSEWAFDANLVGADTDDLQKLLGTSYPAHGTSHRPVSWQGHARESRIVSAIRYVRRDGVDVAFRPRARTAHFAQRRGADCECRGAFARACAGRARGSAHGKLPLSHRHTRSVIRSQQGPASHSRPSSGFRPRTLPLGGRLNMQLRGQGPLLAPELHATLRLVDLKVGDRRDGQF